MSKTGHDFAVDDHVVYPAHGVGQVRGIETQEVAGLTLEVYVITFDHEKMTLRVPTGKARTAGLRPLAAGEPAVIFPEGTFTRAPGLLAFHMGAFAAAAESGRPVVPVTLRGTRSVLRDESWLPRRRPLEVLVHEPIWPRGTDWSEAVRLRNAARAVILEHCGEPDAAAAPA